MVKKRRTSWNKGISPSKESLEKMRLAHLGKKQSLETIEKRVAHLRGKKRDPEIGKKISLRLTGRKQNEAHREKNRLVHLGLKHSDETKTKMRLAQLGEKHHAWKGGTSKLKTAIRSLPESKKWRVSVFVRDGRRCQWCGYTGNNIQADHIIEQAELIAKHKIKTTGEALLCPILWDTNNGRTLCIWCHKRRHRQAP